MELTSGAGPRTRLDLVPSDGALAGAAVAAMGLGAVLAAEGALASDARLAAVGGAAAGLALLVLVAAGWVNGLVWIALAVPLPALYRSDDLRLAAALPLTVAVVAGWVLQRGASASPPSLGRFPLRAWWALLGVFGVATLFAQSPLDSARELANFGLLLVLLVAAVDLFGRDPRRVERTVDALVLAAAVSGALALLEMVGILPGAFPRVGTPFNRAALGFGQPNGLGLFLALVAPLAAHRLTGGGSLARRTAAAFALLAITTGLVATFSRGGILSVLLGGAPLWLIGERRFVLRVWVGGLLLLVAFDVLSGGAMRDTVARSFSDWTLEQRFALMAVGVLTFLAHPVIGVGPGGFAATLDQYGVLVPGLVDLQPTPHNAYIQMAAETGAIGLVVFVVFLAAVLRALVSAARAVPEGADAAGERSLRRSLLWSFGILCLASLLDWPFPHGTGQVAMLVMAMGCARPRQG